MTKKHKIITISDHPLVSSGVGIQTRYIIEHLLKSGKYQIRSLGGAMHHEDKRIQRLTDYGDDWYIFPIEGYGDEDMLREIMDEEKPDAIWFMTDPRFFGWLFNMANEIRERGIPILYYHIWDEYPAPRFNKPLYDVCDFIGCISQLTYNVVKELGHPDIEYIPHAVDYSIFKPATEKEIEASKIEILGINKNKFIFFYNSRNARRKMTADVVRFFKELLDKVGQDKAFLFMHTDPHDQEGSNLVEVAKMLGLRKDQITFSNQRIAPEQMAKLYNLADVTVCISNNEGFGLSSLESMACGTPVISTRTGGLQDQNIDKDTGEVYGVSIIPKTKSLTGSQEIPYIYDCRCTNEDVLEAYLMMYNMPKKERKLIGADAATYVKANFPCEGPESMVAKWERAIERKIKEFQQRVKHSKLRIAKI